MSQNTMVCKNDKQNIVEVETLKVNGGDPEHVTDFLSVEEPLEFHIAGEFDGVEFSRSVAVTMRTPGNDEELALGFLFNESIISGYADVGNVLTKGCNFVGVTLKTGVRVELESMEKVERHSFVNSSCGVCGKKSIAAVMQRRKSHIESTASVRRETISELPNTLRHQQPDFAHTGGIHASALFDLQGNLITVREDVGRHNALDKLIGSQLMREKLPLNECVLLLSGRASFELIQKAAGAGIPIVAAVGAPSSLAVELAKDCGMTLLGFVRDNRFNVYTGGQRILLSLFVAFAILVAGTISGCSNSFSGDKYSRLLLLESQGKYAELIDYCNESLKSSPADPDLFAYRGFAEKSLGKLEPAQADLLRAIELKGNDGWYHCVLGNVYLERRKYKEALQSLTKAKTLLPNADRKASVLSSLAVVHQCLDEPEKAIVEATEALKLAPKQKHTYVTRAQAYTELCELDKALVDVNKTLELDSKNPGTYMTRANIYFEKGDWQNAIADSKTTLDLDKKFWQAIEMQSAAYLANGDVKEALRLVDQFIQSCPDAAAGYADKASCLFAKGDFEQARQLADRALELEPNSISAIQSCIRVAARAGDKGKVKQLIARLKTAGASERRISRTGALASIFLKDYSGAIDSLNGLEAKGDKCPFIYRLRSEAYQRMHKNKLAESDMKKALAGGYSKVSVTEQYLKVQKKD